MKAVIRISTRLRSAAPIPRDFLPISGLEHLGLIHQQKIITTPEEFNETLARVNDSRFPARGCAFFPYMLTAEDEAKMNASPAPVVATPEPEWVAPESTPEYTVAVDVEATPVGEPVAINDDHASNKESSPLAFTLDDKAILLKGERVGGLYGENKQLRVLTAHVDLRPEIEAWLKTIN